MLRTRNECTTRLNIAWVFDECIYIVATQHLTSWWDEGGLLCSIKFSHPYGVLVCMNNINENDHCALSEKFEIR